MPAQHAAQLGDVAWLARRRGRSPRNGHPNLGTVGGIPAGGRGVNGPFILIVFGIAGGADGGGATVQIAARDLGSHRGDQVAAVLG